MPKSRIRSSFSKLDPNLIFQIFPKFDSIWIRSHVKTKSHKSEILHSLVFETVITTGAFSCYCVLKKSKLWLSDWHPKIQKCWNLFTNTCHEKIVSHIKNIIKYLTISNNEWLFVLDVTNLYTHICHDEGIDVKSDLLMSVGYKDPPSKENILQMLNLILKSNCFIFDNDYFLQINAMAMGTKVAPTYTIIFKNNTHAHNINYQGCGIDL